MAEGDVLAGIQQGDKNAQWFVDNANVMSRKGQIIWLEGDTGQFKKGDGIRVWGAIPFSGGTGGVNELSQLTDVDIDTPTNGQVLTYDSVEDKWVNDNPTGGGIEAINGTPNRTTVTGAGTLADPKVIDIASQYDTAVTNAIAAAVAGLTPNTCIMVHSPNTWFSPANGQYYYFGMQNLAATNSVANTATNIREIGAPCTGTIIAAVISIRLDNGGTVSGQASTLFLRNTTAGTFTQVTNSFTYVATGTPSFKSVVVTGLNIPVTQGDLCMSVIGNPTFTVNPSTVYFRIDYLIQT
jgi:hypothetical protein